MKTPTIEELAAIRLEKLIELTPLSGYAHFKDLSATKQRQQVESMQAAITALYASVEGMPNLEDCVEAYQEGGLCNGGGDPFLCGMNDVRNLMLTAHLKVVAGMQAKLDECAKLPEKWCDWPRVNQELCARDLEAALATNEEKPAIAPVPEAPAKTSLAIEEIAKKVHEFYRERIKELPITQPPSWDDLSGWNRGQAIQTCEEVIRLHLSSCAKKTPVESRGEICASPDCSVSITHYQGSHPKCSMRTVVDPVPEVDPYADLKAAAERGEWLQCKSITTPQYWCLPESGRNWHWTAPVDWYRVLETIQHGGKTYFKHTPGDEMPVGGDVEVHTITREGMKQTMRARDMGWGVGPFHPSPYAHAITGYYPVSLAEALGNVEKPKEQVQPPAGLALHNPDNLTPDQVGEGYRLLATAEIERGKVPDAVRQVWEYRESAFVRGGDGAPRFGLNPGMTYRVPITTPWPEVPAEVKPEKWADEKKAHAEGKRIEKREIGWGNPYIFVDCGNPLWEVDEDIEYRVAPGQDSPASPAVAAQPNEMSAAILYQGAKSPEEELEAEVERLKDDRIQALTDLEKARQERNRIAMEERQKWAVEIKKMEASLSEAKFLCEDAKDNGREWQRSAEERAELLDKASIACAKAVGENDALKARIAALTPHRVSVRPTKEDADVDGDVMVFFKDGRTAPSAWSDKMHDATHWLPGNLAKLYPDLPKVEDKERAEFEAWVLSEWPHTKMEQTPSGYSHAVIDNHWKGWQARAGKEAA